MSTGHSHVKKENRNIHGEIESERKKIRQQFKGNLKGETEFIFVAT